MMKYTFPLLITIGVCLPLSASAEEFTALTPEQQADYDDMVQEAVEHYRARRYEDAISLFEKAFDIQPEPEILYNIARCHERLADSEEALEGYRKVLDMSGTTGDLRTRALNNIAALKKEMAAKEALRQTEQDQESAGTDTAGAGGGPGEPGEQTGVTESDTSGATSMAADSDASKGRMKLIGLSLMGGGVAAMAAGSIFGGLALSAKKDFDSAEYDPDKIDYRKDAKRNALIFDIVFSTGAVLTSVGGALFIVHILKNRSTEETATANRTKTKQHRLPSVRLEPLLFVGDEAFTGGLVGRF